MAERPTQFTARQWAAGTALASQLALAFATIVLAALYAIADLAWLRIAAAVALLATLGFLAVALWRIRAERIERRQVKRALE